jgi:predicted PurR-regulated permease PerM
VSGPPDLPEVVGAPVRRRLRISGRSVVAVVAVVTLTLLALRILTSAGRVIAWVLIASSAAALLSPVVELLRRRIPRGIAVAVVALSTLALVGGVTYGLVDAVVHQTSNLEEVAPRLAQQVEEDSRFSEAATEFDLSERTEVFVRKVPERLRGGTPADAIRSAATRGLSFLAVFILTVFFLLHGPDLAEAAERQIHDDERRAHAEHVAVAVYRRAFGYARGTLAMATLAGLVAYVLARVTEVPSPLPLALWVVLWDAVPLVGAVVGALPIIVIAGIIDPAHGVLLFVAFAAYQALEYVLLQRRLERSTMRLGPFLTVFGGFAGLELYGLSGALLTILGLAIAGVVLDESTTA